MTSPTGPFRPWRRRALLYLAAPLLLGLIGCAVPSAPAAEPLWGTEWRLQSLNGRAVLAGAPATLAFPEAGRVGGNGSCNRFFNSASLDGDRLLIDQLGSTQMACQRDAMGQENRYLAALHKVWRMERLGDTMTLHLQGAGPPLRFVRVK